MIIYHQTNVAAFAGNHTYWWLVQQILLSRVSVTSAAPTEQGFGPHLLSIPAHPVRLYFGRFA